MGGGGSAPQFNASQVSNQQTNSNINTAAANSYLNAINQYTPYGNLIWKQTNTRQMGDGTASIPEWQVTTELSPNQQGLLTQQEGLQSRGLNLAGDVLGRVQKAVNTDLPGDQTAFRDQAYDALTARGQQQIDRGRNSARTLLANQGVQPGSEAWKREMQTFGEQTNDLSNQAFLQAGNLADQELGRALTIRNQPLADYQALLGLSSGVAQPSFQNTQQQPIANTDVTTPAMQAYQGQMNAYNQQVGQQNALMGGLFGLGGSVLGGLARTPKMFGLG